MFEMPQTYQLMEKSARSHNLKSLPSEDPELLKKEKMRILYQLEKQQVQAWKLVKDASPKLWQDREFALKMVRAHKSAITKVHVSLLGDSDIILAAISYGKGEAFTYAHKKLQADQSFVLQAVGVNREVLGSVKEKWRSDQDFMLKAIGIYPQASKWAHVKLMENRHFILKALDISGLAFDPVCGYWQKDPEIILKAISKGNLNAFGLANYTLNRNRDFIRQAFDIGGVDIFESDESFYANKEIMLEFVANQPQLYFKMSKNLRADKDLFLLAISHDESAMYAADEKLRADEAIGMEAIKRNGLVVFTKGGIFNQYRDQKLFWLKLSTMEFAKNVLLKQLQQLDSGGKQELLKKIAAYRKDIAHELASEPTTKLGSKLRDVISKEIVKNSRLKFGGLPSLFAHFNFR